MPTPRVTAIVVTHGAAREQLNACLTSLATSEGVDLRVVLVDNASPDGGQVAQAEADRVAERVPVSFVQARRNRGFAAGVNAGLAVSSPGMVWLLNDDAVVAPTTIRRCVDALEAASATTIAIAPVVHLDVPDPTIDSAGLVLRPNGEAFGAGLGQPDVGQYRSGDECFGPCFAAGLFRAGAFETAMVGPLDERYFMYYEDVDWATRAALAGYRVELLANSGVRHGHAASARRLGEDRRFRLVQRNLLVFATVNLSIRRTVSIWGSRAVVHTKGLLTGPHRRARLTAFAGALIRLPALFVARRARRRPAVDEDVIFRFAEDEAPFLVAGTFTVADPAGAAAAAQRRLARLR